MYARRFVLTIAWLAAAPASAWGQIGATTDIITGTVRAENGAPIEGAEVEVTSLETNITRRTRTNSHGKYTILFPDGGGDYRVSIRALGLAPVLRELRRLADEDRLVVNATMSLTAARLSTVAVQGRQTPRTGADLPTPGSIERVFTPEQVARLPVDMADLLNLALLSPQVVSISATDSTAAGFSVAGLRPDANAVTLDGLSFGTTQLPQEATRSTRVITNTYDVSRGQFSGGMIASTTRSGTNEARGNFGYSLRDDDLTLTADEESPLAQGYTQHQLSGGLGRAIVKDQLFIFGSAQLRRREDVLPSLFNADARTLSSFAINPDSVRRFFDIVEARGLTPGAFFDETRLADNISGIVRLDWMMQNGHSLTLRGDWSWTGQDPSRVGTLSLPQTGGTSEGWSSGVMATYTSLVANKFLNELKAYASLSRNEAQPFLTLPSARVQVASELAVDSARGISLLSFGGNAALPQDGRSRSVEITDEVSWLTETHRFKLGGLLNMTSFEQAITANRWGTYTFTSLAALEANQATSFTRTLSPNVREGTQLNAALYLGDVWTPRRGLQLTYGVRGEGGRFGDEPAYNPLVAEAFGYRTDYVPTELRLSPRVGFTWTIGGQADMPGGMPPGGGGPGGGMGGGQMPGGRGGMPGMRFGASGSTPTVIRGGVGEFRGTVSPSLFSAAANATGLSDSESQLICTGAGVPSPNWTEFLSNSLTIPTACVGGNASQSPSALPGVTVFERDFAAPRAWRASLGLQRRAFDRYNISLDLGYSRGLAQTGYRDRNLATSPAFTLDNEGGRPVFVPAATIDPGSGTTNLLNSRSHASFGQVLTVGSDLKSESRQLTLSLGGLTGRGAVFNIGYTLGWSWDHSSGGGFAGFSGPRGGAGFAGRAGGMGGFASATTAGDPNRREWASSDFDRRHSITGSLTYPISLGLEITATGRVTSGAPFTPLVGSDINGDGARNDRAFLFDPSSASTDTAIAAGMNRLLTTAPQAVQSCLRNQLGDVAARNSCRGPWQPSLELQLNWRPQSFGINRRLMLSVTTQNLLGGLDELLHGSNNLHGWGALRGQDNTLLYVQGFDAVANRYAYQVNERFGASRRGLNGITVPFQIGINARFMIGPDRMRDGLDALRGAAFGARGGRAGRGGVAGSGGGPPPFAALLGNVNPVKQILDLKDSLQLTDSQFTALAALADSLDARNTVLAQDLRKQMDAAGANPDMAALMSRMRPQLDELRQNQQAALKQAEGTLTKEQWLRVPERIKSGRGLPPPVDGRRPPP